MRAMTWRHWIAGLLAAVIGGMLTTRLRAEQPPASHPQNLVILADDAAAAATDAAPGDFWLGVACEPLSDADRAGLHIPKDQGLVVRQVLADGPAAKAGLKPGDILLQAGDKPLAATADLLSAVAAAKTHELSLKLLRDGKPLTIAATPAERPKTLPGDVLPVPQLPAGPGRELIDAWLKEHGIQSGQTGRVQIVRPGAAVLMGSGIRQSTRVELPDNVSIDIHREGKKPAQITVKRGDEKWDVSEDELAKLPDDVRRLVEPLLGRGPMRIDIHSLPFGPNALPGAGSSITAGQADLNGAVSALQRQVELQRRAMDDLSRQMLELNRAMIDLQRQREQPAAPSGK